MSKAKSYSKDAFNGSTIIIPTRKIKSVTVVYNNVQTIPSVSYDNQEDPRQMTIDIGSSPSSNVIVRLT